MKRKRAYRMDRVVPGVGRLTARCPSLDARKVWDSLVTELYDTGRLEILRQLKAGTLTFREVLDAQRRGALTYAADSVILSRPLWSAVGLAEDGTTTGDGWLAIAADAKATRTRYAVAWRPIQRAGVLGSAAFVRDLETVSWPRLRRNLAMGATGWNHIRRAVSSFLTHTLNDKQHPFRVSVLRGFPKAEEPEGLVPDLPVEQFWAILEHVPAPLKACYVTMAASGMGPGEYLRCQEHHLLPLTHGLKVVGTKQGRKGEHVVRIGPGAWPYVLQAIPSPVSYWKLRDVWKKACRAVGQRDDRLYGLRHCHGQWATDAGVSEARVGQSLRDKTAATIRRYTRSQDRGEVAGALDTVMFPTPEDAQGAYI